MPIEQDWNAEERVGACLTQVFAPSYTPSNHDSSVVKMAVGRNISMNDMSMLAVQQAFLKTLLDARKAERHLPAAQRQPSARGRLRFRLGEMLIGLGEKMKGVGPVTWAGA